MEVKKSMAAEKQPKTTAKELVCLYSNKPFIYKNRCQNVLGLYVIVCQPWSQRTSEALGMEITQEEQI